MAVGPVINTLLRNVIPYCLACESNPDREADCPHVALLHGKCPECGSLGEPVFLPLVVWSVFQKELDAPTPLDFAFINGRLVVPRGWPNNLPPELKPPKP